MATAKSVGHSSCFRESWLHEHHRVCSSPPSIFQSPSHEEGKGTSACKRPLCESVTDLRQVTTSWIFSLAHSPRMTCTHRNPRAGGERVKAVLQSYWFLSACKYQRIRPRCRPRCVAPSRFHTCMYDRQRPLHCLR